MKGISYRSITDMHTDGVYFDKDEKVVVVTSHEKKEKVEEVVIGNS